MNIQLIDDIVVLLGIIFIYIILHKSGFRIFRVSGYNKSNRYDKIDNNGLFQYEYKNELFTDNEKMFFIELDNAVGEKYFIFTKVRIADLYKVRKEEKENKKLFYMIANKHIDFVVVDKKHLKPVLLLELDDSSHDIFSVIKRDEFVNNLVNHSYGEKLFLLRGRCEKARVNGKAVFTYDKFIKNIIETLENI